MKPVRPTHSGPRFSVRTAGLAIMVILASPAGSVFAQQLPRPAEIEPDVRFWTRVYTEIDTTAGFVHDDRNLDVVYRTLRYEEGASQRSRDSQIRAAFEDIRETLRVLGTGKRDNLTEAQRQVLSLWPDDVSNRTLSSAVDRLRFQRGQANRFRAGLIRAGRWKPYIREVLRVEGVPAELVALPHVESSFEPTAYSRAGAAGMWQFTRSTGLRYMRIDHIVDDRRDPFFSTVAAARLLRDNYEVLQNWALAITAYNHGQAGMRNAVRSTGSDRIEVILRQYSGRAFGFASRNFYVAFLAAVDVDANAEEFFGPLTPDPEALTSVINVPDFLTVSTLTGAFDISHEDLRNWNPALTAAVWSEEKFVPKGFRLRLPAQQVPDPLEPMASVPASQRYTAQRPDILHRVQRGDTISGIATRYRVSQAALVELNNLRSRNFIREGQVLRLPGNDGTRPVALAQRDGLAVADTPTYVVRAGDSIDRIARMFGVTPEALLARNSIPNANRIYVGQQLNITASAADSAVPTAEPEPAAATPALAEAGAPDEPVAAQVVAAEQPAAPAPEEPGEPAIEVAAVEEPRLTVAMATAEEGGAGEPPLQSGEVVAVAGDVNVLASAQAEMAGDPSDYLVRDDRTIEVQALETLGHYADWLEIRTQRLRDINGMPFREPVVIGRRLTLDFSQVPPAVFEARRIEYQQQTQEAFFRAFQVTGVEDHVVSAGESLWELSLGDFRVPVWLVRQYNPDLDLDRVAPEMVVRFPVLRPREASDAG